MLGIKRIENRSWAAPRSLIGERIAIHASALAPAQLPREIASLALPPIGELTANRGVILGTVRLAHCLYVEDLPYDVRQDPFAEGDFCWLLAEPIPLASPTECKGALRLWDVPPPILSAIRAAV